MKIKADGLEESVKTKPIFAGDTLTEESSQDDTPIELSWEEFQTLLEEAGVQVTKENLIREAAEILYEEASLDEREDDDDEYDNYRRSRYYRNYSVRGDVFVQELESLGCSFTLEATVHGVRTDSPGDYYTEPTSECKVYSTDVDYVEVSLDSKHQAKLEEQNPDASPAELGRIYGYVNLAKEVEKAFEQTYSGKEAYNG